MISTLLPIRGSITGVADAQDAHAGHGVFDSFLSFNGGSG